MKIQHWAIIFIIIMLPLSIVCRNIISKKNLNLRDETRYNNIIDNATYDAVSQILEVSEELGYGKNIPITENVAMAAIDRFFNTLNVNFNLPINDVTGQNYFNQYIPAVIIVGYDGIYVYSCEETANGFQFKLKPKIPYSYTHVFSNGQTMLMNFTLDNFVTLYFTNEYDLFMKGIPDEDGNLGGTHFLSGYVGEPLDVDGNGIDDLNDMVVTVEETDELGNIVSYNVLVADDGTGNQYEDNDDPYQINLVPVVDKPEYIKQQIASFSDNLSYFLKELANSSTTDVTAKRAKELTFLYEGTPNQDYEFNDRGEIIEDASEFHKLRRDTIVNLITSVMTEEFNEHNMYADLLGVTYNFTVPNIARDRWYNTIDDISVLAFMQGMPMGGEIYYNNYSLGGARIVKANMLYAETVADGLAEHKVYHKYYCPLIPRDNHGNIRYDDGTGTYEPVRIGGVPQLLPNGNVRKSTGIQKEYINADHARQEGYYVCSECM